MIEASLDNKDGIDLVTDTQRKLRKLQGFMYSCTGAIQVMAMQTFSWCRNGPILLVSIDDA